MGSESKTAAQSHAPELSIDYSDFQLPASDEWLYVVPEYPETFPS